MTKTYTQTLKYAKYNFVHTLKVLENKFLQVCLLQSNEKKKKNADTFTLQCRSLTKKKENSNSSSLKTEKSPTSTSVQTKSFFVQ